VTQLIDLALSVGIATAGQELQRKWVDVLTRLCGLGPLDLFRHQADYRVDLLLRVIEGETLGRILAGEAFNVDAQVTLTPGWLFSTYEIVRMAQETPTGRSHWTLVALRKQIELVRVPMAKLEIANDAGIKEPLQFERIGEGTAGDVVTYSAKSKAPIYPAQGFCLETGSLAWWVYDTKSRSMVQVTRRMHSDMMLALWDEDARSEAS
jgi:hypothetical protein